MSTHAALPSVRQRIILALLFCLGFALLLLALHWIGLFDLIRSAKQDKEGFLEGFRGTGSAGVLAFLGLLAIRPLTFVPGVYLAPVAALLFGPWFGALYKVLGETLGACVAFGVARFGLARAVRRTPDPDSRRILDRLGRTLERRSFRTVLALRFNLLIPYDGLNYGLGLTRVRFWPYALGTLLGIVPGTFAYVALAGKAIEGDWIMTAVLIAGIAVMILLAIPLAKDLVRDEGTGGS